jgi:hypothetical protein
MFSENLKNTLYNDIKNYLSPDKRYCHNCIIEELDFDTLCCYCKDHRRFNKHDKILFEIII